MLYRIDNRTWIDLPRWKCRPEFAEFYRELRARTGDVDKLGKLKAKCDIIEQQHNARVRQSIRMNGVRWSRDRGSVSPTATAIDVFTLRGRFLDTYPSSCKASEALFGDKRHARAIKKCVRGVRHSHGEYQFREHVDGVKPKNIGSIYKNRTLYRPVDELDDDGVVIRKHRTVTACAKSLGIDPGSVIWGIKHRSRNRKHGTYLKYHEHDC